MANRVYIFAPSLSRSFVPPRYGATDLVKGWKSPRTITTQLYGERGWNEQQAIEHITGGQPGDRAEDYEYLSPVAHVGPYTPPTIIFHCSQVCAPHSPPPLLRPFLDLMMVHVIDFDEDHDHDRDHDDDNDDSSLKVSLMLAVAGGVVVDTQDEFFDPKVHADSLEEALTAAEIPHLKINPVLHSHGCDIGSTVPFQLLRFAMSRFLAAVATAEIE